jgi:outer membrane protein OmpA-like peptidoglycan-associated protein/tetratricopeptide (TPR) repeat protein
MKTKILYIRRILTVSLLLFISISAVAQTELQQAQALKAKYDYSEAIKMYLSSFKSTPALVYDMREITECYMMINDTKSAEEWLSKIVSQSEATAEDVLHYADVLKTNGNYNEAITQFKDYALLNPSDNDNAAKEISSCKDALSWIADPPYITVNNAEVFNSENCDFGVMKFGDGYIFSSDRKLSDKVYTNDEIYGWTGRPYLKLYYISGINSSNPASKAEPVTGLNAKYQNGAGVYDEADNTIYFTRTKMVRISMRPVNSDPTSWFDNSKAGDYVNRWEIYSAKNTDGKWENVKSFEYNNAENYSVGQPAVSPVGKVMYFVSDMAGGFGKTDIYFCTKLSDGKWSKPVNAGSKINTEGREAFPFIDKDGKLYFSSDGLPGMGGLDIFYAEGIENGWSDPVNLKYPMNTSKDDFSVYFTETGTTGYLSSNRDGGKGEDDIYYFAPDPPKTLILAGITKERSNDSLNILSGVTIKMEDKVNNVSGTLTSNTDGRFFAKIDCNTAYDLAATKTGHFAASATVQSECRTKHDTVFVELILDKYVINKPIVIKNIYYDFDKWNIRPDAATELDKLVAILAENSEINIELGSHTDARGSFTYNDALSQKRAESAVDYIISKGILSGRITAKGYGERVPVNQCIDGVKCSEEDFQLNRRTEFKVTSITNNIIEQ